MIQRQLWSDIAADTAFWLNVGSTFCFVTLAVVAAFCLPLADSSPAWLFAALSTTLLIDGSRAVHEARLRRSFSYKVLAMRTVLASTIGGAAGILAALGGLGAWALVVQRLVTSAVQTVAVWKLAEFRPSLRFARNEVLPLLSFSTRVMVGRLMAQMNARLPDFVIGFVAGPAALGLFRVAARSLNFLVQSILTPLQATSLSAFARLKDSDTVARAYGRFTQISAIFIFPAFLGSAAIAPDFILVFFGEKWADGMWIMVALSFAVLPRTLFQFFQPAMQAVGKPQRAISLEATRLVMGAVIVTGASFAGPLAAASGDTARRYLAMPQSLRILRKELGLDPWQLMKGVAVPMLCSLTMAGVVVLVRLTWLADWDPRARLPLCVVIGATTYLTLLLVMARRFLADVLSSARHGLPQRFQHILDRCLSMVRIRPIRAAEPG